MITHHDWGRPTIENRPKDWGKGNMVVIYMEHRALTNMD